MRTDDLLRTSAKGITTNKSRTILTMLGIIIGVGSVVLMVSIGKSFENYILTQLESFGTDTIDVYPTGFERIGANLNSITEDDYEAMRRLTTIDLIAPVIFVTRSVSYGREDVNPMIFGTTPDIFAIYGLNLADGRLLDQSDIDAARNVAVISHQTAIDLFGNRDPIGEKIGIGEARFTVVGVLEGLGSLLLQDLDKPVYVPYTAARTLVGQRHLSYITVKAAGDPELTRLDITSLLRQRHRINNPDNDPDKDDFIARSAEQIISIVNSVTLGLTLFLGIVAAISLLVGGIGIMNIMLVSVTERTREIGLRKAVGARKRDILLQFLLESVTLTFAGGIIGIIGGMTLGWILATLADRVLGQFSYFISVPGILLAVAMAVGTGLVFGIYPARRAANLSPMEALRYE